MSPPIRVGVVIGSNLAPNERAVLRTLTKLLKPKIELELIVSYEYSEDLERETLNIYKTPKPPFSFFKIPLFYELFISIWSVLYYINNRKPDILHHCTKPYLYGLTAVIAGKLKSIPVLGKIGGEVFDWHKYQSGFSKFLIIFGIYPLAFLTFHLADHIVSVGKQLIKMLKKIGIPETKITLARWPVDTDLFNPFNKKEQLRKELGIPTDRTIVLTVGRLEKVEKVGYFPEIVKKSIERRGDLFFVFVGETGRYRKKIEKQCGEHVEFAGVVPNSEMPKYYNAADLYMHLSLTEGSVAGTILEAINCDTPVVSTPSGEAKEFLPVTCNSTEEFIQFLQKEQWSKTELPPEFDNSEIRKRYLEILTKIQN